MKKEQVEKLLNADKTIFGNSEKDLFINEIIRIRYTDFDINSDGVIFKNGKNLVATIKFKNITKLL